MTDFTLSAAALSGGFCPYGHQGEPAELHGTPVLTCRECECSWLIDTEGTVWGMACVPGDHTCGEERVLRRVLGAEHQRQNHAVYGGET